MKLFAAIVVGLFLPAGLSAQSKADKAKDTKKETPAAPAATKATANAVSEREIDDARSKGLVWVNTDSKIYHKDGEFYGKTKQGKFMTESDAQKAGYRAAKQGAAKKKDASKK